jgi:hypothetical protein
LRGVAGRVRIGVPENGVGEAHRHRPVGQGVVDAPHERRAAAGAGQHVDPPQRARPVEPLGEQPRNLGAQHVVVAGLRLDRDDVGRDVEAPVVDPGWAIRGPPEAARHGRHHRQAPRDRGAEPLGRGSAGSEQHHLAGMAGDGLALQLQDRAIGVAQGDALHARILPPVWAARA